MYKFYIKFHNDPNGSIDIDIEGNKTVQDLETAIIRKKQLPTGSKITFIYRAQQFTKDDGLIQSVPALSSVSQNIKVIIHAVVIQPRNNPEQILVNREVQENTVHQQVDNPNNLFMVTENNNRNLSAELCEFFFTPGWALLTNIGLAIRQNQEFRTYELVTTDFN